MTELPKGWVSATLDELNDPERPICYGILKPGPDLPDGVPYVKVKNIRDETVDVGQLHRTSPEIDAKYRRSRLRPGDLLVSIRGTYGRVAPVPAELSRANITQDSARIAPVGVQANYLQKYLQGPTAQQFFAEVARGVAVKGVNIRDLRQTPVHVPPLAEQERVVAAIAEAFSKLDVGETGLCTVRQLLKRTRGAILAAAVSGRLVPQDPTDPPAAKLLAAAGVEPIEVAGGAPSVPSEWVWCQMRALASGAGYGTSVRCGYDEAGVGVLRIPNIRRGALDTEDLKRAPFDASIGEDLILTPGDLLVVRTNGSRDLIGRAAPVTRDTGYSFASYLIRFRTRPELVRVEYLALLLAAPWWRERLEAAAASSAGQYNLSLRTLEPLPVALPPLAEQARIVAEVERQMSFVDACERSVDAGLEVSAALRRSVLKAAFEGRLVPQDPTDEPASVLLERIRTDRAATPKPKKRRAKATA